MCISPPQQPDLVGERDEGIDFKSRWQSRLPGWHRRAQEVESPQVQPLPGEKPPRDHRGSLQAPQEVPERFVQDITTSQR